MNDRRTFGAAPSRAWALAWGVPFVVTALLVSHQLVEHHALLQRKFPEWLVEVVPDRWQAFRVMAYLCVPLMLLAFTRLSAVGRRWAYTKAGRWIYATILGTTVVLSGFHYAYNARVLRHLNYLHRHDAFHYTLGPKYFDETGYEALYECLLETDAAKRVPDKTRVRDLRTYTNTNALRTRRKRHCQNRFTPERWAEFEQDVSSFFSNSMTPDGVMRPGWIPNSVLSDNGYNGTPLHAFMMKAWTESMPPLMPQTIIRMFMVDVWAIMLCGWVVCLAVGWRLGMTTAIFFFVNAADRMQIVGGSPGRYLWVVILGLGLAALLRRRTALGAACLTVATALVAFPVFAWLGGLISTFGQRGLDAGRAFKRYMISSILVGALCLGLGAAHGHGVNNYREWAENMSMHVKGVIPKNVTPGHITSIPGFGMGLKFAMLSVTPVLTKPGRVDGIYRFRWIRPLYLGLGITFTLGTALLVSRLRAGHAALALGIIGFFSLQGTVGYYFVCASFLPLLLGAAWLPSRRDLPPELDADALSTVHPASDLRFARFATWTAVLELLLFAINGYALLYLADTQERFKVYGIVLSWGIGAWLLLWGLSTAWFLRPWWGARIAAWLRTRGAQPSA